MTKRSLSLDVGLPIAQSASLTVFANQQAATNAAEYRTLQRHTFYALNTCLTPRQREILTGYYLQGDNIPALALRLGLNKSTVSRHLAAAKRRLRRTVCNALKGGENTPDT